MLRECSLGITSECPRVHGLMSMKASVLSSSSILCEGMSPATILQNRQSGSVMSGWRLQPLDAPEVGPQPCGDAEHHEQRDGIAVVPLELRHVLEVHAVDAGYQRRDRQDRSPCGDRAHLLV